MQTRDRAGQDAEDAEGKRRRREAGKRRGDIKTEWDHDFRLKLKKELREEVKIECNRLNEKIEEERKEMKIFMEEMKEVKEMKLKIEDEIREKETIKVKSLCKMIEKERETYLEELKEMKEIMKYEIENLKKLRREKDEVESEREIDEFYRLKEILKEERKELKSYMEEIRIEKVSRPKIIEEINEEVTIKLINMNEVIEIERSDLKDYMVELKELEEVMKNEIDEKEGFQKIVKKKKGRNEGKRDKKEN